MSLSLNFLRPAGQAVICLLIFFIMSLAGRSQSPPGLGLQIENSDVWLNVTGQVGTVCTIQYTTNLASLNGWLTLTNFLLSNSPSAMFGPLQLDEPFCAYRAFLDASPTNTVATNVFYVDNAGSDNNSGLMGSPFKTVAKGVSVLGPGKTLKLASGQTFSVTNLVVSASGTPGSPVLVTTTGADKATLISTNSSGIVLTNNSWLTINNLKIVGNTNWIEKQEKFYDYGIGHWGVVYYNGTTGSISHVTVQNCEVLLFDVGISCVAWSVVGINDFTVVSNSVHDIADDGIFVWAYNEGKQYVSITNPVVAFNVVSNCYGNSNEVSGVAIALGMSQNGLVFSNTVHDGGMRTTSASGGGAGGIVVVFSDGATVSHNEAYRFFAQSGNNVDGIGIDLDLQCSNCRVESNYAHDNEGCGYYLFSAYGGNTFCFNVGINNGVKNGTQQPYEFYSNGTGHTNTLVYNNTFISSIANHPAIRLDQPLPGTSYFLNNIFVVSNAVSCISVADDRGLHFSGNDYYQIDGGTPQFNWAGNNYSSLASFRSGTGQ